MRSFNWTLTLNARLCFPLEDASGDGELDLSGIDDLEIDRVSAVSSQWPSRGVLVGVRGVPGCAPLGSSCGLGAQLHIPLGLPSSGRALSSLSSNACSLASGKPFP